MVNETDRSVSTLSLMNNHVQDAFFLKMVTLNSASFLHSVKVGIFTSLMALVEIWGELSRNLL